MTERRLGASVPAGNRPAAEGIGPGHFPPSPVPVNHVAPAPRRVRGMVAGDWLFDTTRALYVWEHPHYPRYHVPHAAVAVERLVASDDTITDEQGRHRCYGIRTPAGVRPQAAHRVIEAAVPGIDGTWRFDWKSIDRWFEEDEEIFVHPRSPYVRVDAVPSSRPVRVSVGGTTLAAASWSVHVFETGLPTRYYLPPAAVAWSLLSPSPTSSQCPYKGVADRYWHAHVNGRTLDDVAWSYRFPVAQVLPIAGLVAFLHDEVDVVLADGAPGRPGS